MTYFAKVMIFEKKSTIMPIERCEKSVLFAPAQRHTMEMSGICDTDITL